MDELTKDGSGSVLRISTASFASELVVRFQKSTIQMVFALLCLINVERGGNCPVRQVLIAFPTSGYVAGDLFHH